MKNKNYDYKGSHTCCWNQGKSSACGQPIENHKQCCLCDTPFPAERTGDKGRIEIPTPIEEILKEFEEKFKAMLDLTETFAGVSERKNVADFLRQSLLRYGERIGKTINEELEKKYQKADLSLMELSQAQDIGYNQAIRHSIETVSAITHNKEK
jgi:hypothetical protein